jgi:hypothetical protein
VGACAALVVGAYTLYSCSSVSVPPKVAPSMGASEGGVGDGGSFIKSPEQMAPLGSPDNVYGYSGQGIGSVVFISPPQREALL